MAGWVLVPCLVCLRAEIDRLAPGRDKRSDGAIGDLAHQAAGTSDHLPDESSPKLRGKDADSVDEVHAIDVDSSGPWPAGWSMGRIVQTIADRHRAGADDRLQNIIYDRRIASRSWGWTWRAYSGASPHTEHAHFSARYTTAQENDVRPWGLAEEDTMTKAEFLALLKDQDVRAALATAVLGTDGVVPAPAGSKNADGTPNTHWTVNSFLLNILNAAVAGRDSAGQAKTGVAALAAKDLIDETALARALTPLLPGINVTPAQLQAAFVGALRELAAPSR
ncbi:hypothetical protein [Actinoplanes rectilineatus]|uniref:hypothetical protein n=1 Tax=Actinoplanes rectilineatus TaxID=113571 RepID=UPI0006982A05|nr:hypothetical protein [Actinoplanes rectilineatus]